MAQINEEQRRRAHMYTVRANRNRVGGGYPLTKAQSDTLMNRVDVWWDSPAGLRALMAFLPGPIKTALSKRQIEVALGSIINTRSNDGVQPTE